ncbi:MAG: hypothetical protein QW552_04730 [Ignisphaera sp.]
MHLLVNVGVNLVLAFLVTIYIDIIIGPYHGFIVTIFSPPLSIVVPAFVTTLGSLFLLREV